MAYTLSMFGILILLGGLAYALWRLIKCATKNYINQPSPAQQCPCGYDLSAAKIPRCPECGRAIGFNATFEDLGISEREVQSHIAAKSSANS